MASTSNQSDLSAFPSVTQLYASGECKPSKSSTKLSHSPRLNSRVHLTCGDMTKLKVDAIVNAANKSLMGGGGVDGAIWLAAGHTWLLGECGKLGGCDPGRAKMTGGGQLPATHIIHAVGPVYQPAKKAECAELLRSCYRTCMEIAHGAGLQTIAFRGISTGAFQYPKVEAARIALAEVKRFLESSVDMKPEVLFCTYSAEDEALYRREISSIYPDESAGITIAPGSG